MLIRPQKEIIRNDRTDLQKADLWVSSLMHFLQMICIKKSAAVFSCRGDYILRETSVYVRYQGNSDGRHRSETGPGRG